MTQRKSTDDVKPAMKMAVNYRVYDPETLPDKLRKKAMEQEREDRQ